MRFLLVIKLDRSGLCLKRLREILQFQQKHYDNLKRQRILQAWASFPKLSGTCYFSLVQVIGPFSQLVADGKSSESFCVRKQFTLTVEEFALGVRFSCCRVLSMMLCEVRDEKYPELQDIFHNVPRRILPTNGNGKCALHARFGVVAADGFLQVENV